MSNILDLSNEKALEFFMKNENYNSLGLPEYIDFTPVLDFVKKTVAKNTFNNILKNNNIKPSSFDKVNYKMLINKDGKFAYRPLQLANPYLYYLLVREITLANNWAEIKKRFKYFADQHIEVSSILVEKSEKDKTIMATTIINWWNCIEQRTI